ncbi:hypothetical protein K2173_015736 [Erythroxylum novogranatense]|uniref:Uncharacterized protein n=1 Tax=Erythroxylum novogranatense TaxID=1862640 RepID=A0AAV8SEW2_9ROSI|nr:hypothetical protein K2173_015736 [Erythroxylum novogranatense]
MDTLPQEHPNSINRFVSNHGPISCSSNRNLLNGFNPTRNLSNSHPPVDSTSFTPSNDLTSFLQSSNPESDQPGSNATLKYINDMLMEEDLEGKNCMLQDCLALQAAEKSFYDVLGQEYPHSSGQSLSFLDQISENPVDSSNSSSSVDTQNFDAIFSQDNLPLSGLQSFLMDSPVSILLGPDFPVELQPLGLKESGIRELAKSLQGYDSLVLAPNGNSAKPSDHEKRDQSPTNVLGRKSHQREDIDDLEGRSSKHSAFSLAESEQSDMFDQVLLCPGTSNGSTSGPIEDKSQSGASRNGNRKGSNGRASRVRKQGNQGELVDLWTPLTQCAQAVGNLDQRTATDLLKQITQHSSRFGDGNQRLAHYFASALETRLAGTRAPTYTPLLSNKTPAVDILRAYQVFVKACPFKRMSNFFANRTIIKFSEKATRLHIIDFGILYGFQWPCLIQRLSERTGGPPKLRITGIELPQPGFRPAERVEETGRRLARYCERFNVPFEYNVIAQKWETIKYEDLKIDRDEMTVVNCLYRLRNLPDDTVVANSARDAVLKLIKSIRPDLFIHGVVNGNYNAPFFVTRFREALFHFSSLFDMFEATVPREDEQRLLYEKEIFGRDITNVIACEGIERVERPETYKQWQLRNLRIGFRQLQLDQDILRNVKSTVKSEYDENFVVDQDGQWMLQGWKGRIVYALSVWKPLLE